MLRTESLTRVFLAEEVETTALDRSHRHMRSPGPLAHIMQFSQAHGNPPASSRFREANR